MTTLNLPLTLLPPFIIIITGFSSFVSYRKHLLNALLSLEFTMLGIFWILSWSFTKISIEIYLIFFFLTLVVCEGALGLSLLISIVRTHGNDYFNSLSSTKC